MELLQEYNFTFKYKRGALSRRPDYREISTLSVQLKPRLRQRLIDGYQEDLRLQPIYESMKAASREVHLPIIPLLMAFSEFNVRYVPYFVFSVVLVRPGPA